MLILGLHTNQDAKVLLFFDIRKFFLIEKFKQKVYNT